MPSVTALIPIHHNGDGDFVSVRDWDDYVYGGIHSAFDFTEAPRVAFKSVATGITASTTQAQGQQPLTNNFNEISVCANDDDVITMPSVRAGAMCLVVHSADHELQVFPASGDNFDGEAVNASITMYDTVSTVSPSTSLFIGKDNDEWFKLNHIVTGIGVSSSLTFPADNAEVAFFKNCSTGNNSTELAGLSGVNSGVNFHYTYDGADTAGLNFNNSNGDTELSIKASKISTTVGARLALQSNFGDPYIVWRGGGGSGTWFCLGRDASESTTILKCTYGSTMASNALYRLQSNGTFHFERGNGIYLYGVGDSLNANNEYVRMYHSGTGAYINSGSSGSGTVRPFYLQTGGVTAITIANTQDVQFTNNATVMGGAELRLSDVGDSNYTGWKAPALTGNQVYTMPTADGSNTNVLKTNGSLVTSWSAVNLVELTETRKTANSMTVTTGTLSSGTVSDTQTWGDGNSVNISEVTGVPGFDVRFTFTSVTDFSRIGVSAYYTGAVASHYAEFQIYDDTNTTWRTLFTFDTGSGFNYRYSDLPVSAATRVADYINGSNEVLIRFYHPTTGNASHDLYIDYVSLIT